MGRNGQRHPGRPRIEVRQPASPEEAAAIAAAIEQFMRDTAPPPGSDEPALSAWLRAGLLEGTKRDPGDAPWRYGFSPR
jgi:DNA-binding PadR family transcriptional regulator